MRKVLQGVEDGKCSLTSVRIISFGRADLCLSVKRSKTSKQKRSEEQRGVVVLLDEKSDEEDSETESETGMEGGWRAVTAWYEHWVSIVDNKA